MRNNVIAIVAISFAVVGALWGIGNLATPQRDDDTSTVGEILLVARNNAFNETNPDIRASVNVPKKLVVVNNDIVTHDLIIKESSGAILNINTAPLRPEQHFNAAILAYRAGTFEYFCSYHPQMRGNIIVD